MTASVVAAVAAEIRELRSADECAQCEPLYREVFGLAPGDGSVNGRLLVALGRNSGIVVGAYAAGSLVGFALSFLARDDGTGRLYQYSQTAAVAPQWQGRGIGRALKFGQRGASLDRDIGLVRWTFDPLRAANAHFNLDVLGAVVTGLTRDFYGGAAVPADRGEPTDRFTVSWELCSDRVLARAAAAADRGVGSHARREPPACARPGLADTAPVAAGELRLQGARALLGVPANWARLRHQSPARAADLRGRIVNQADALIQSGMVAVSCCRASPETAVYRFAKP